MINRNGNNASEFLLNAEEGRMNMICLCSRFNSYGVLTQHRHKTGSWRDCMRNKADLHQKVFSMFHGLPFGWSLPRHNSLVPDMLSATETYIFRWLPECPGTFWIAMSSKPHLEGYKKSTNKVQKAFENTDLTQVPNIEEVNINCGVCSPQEDDTSRAIWILLVTARSSGRDDLSGRTQVSLWAIPPLGPLRFWSQTPGKQNRVRSST